MTKALFRFLSILLFLLLTSSSLNAQGTLTYKITVLGARQAPKPNLPITLIETSTFKRKTFKTNSLGQLTISLTEGKEWMMNVGDMKNHTLLKMPQGTSSGSAHINYDVARWNRINQPPVDRSKLNIEVLPQKIASTQSPDKENSIVEIHVKSEEGQAWRGIPVALTTFKLEKSFTAFTDNAGIARFKVPVNQSYQIDLDGEQNFEYYDVGPRPSTSSMGITYNKINFKEVVNADGYIEQVFIDKVEAVSNRVMVTLNIQGGPKDGIGEDVYLEMDYSNKKYHGKTDENGQLVFLLPKKYSYHVNFNFQKDAGIIDLTRFFGIGSMSRGYYYQPDPRLQFPEQYLPSMQDVKSYDINNYNAKEYPDSPGDELLNVYVKWGNNKINSGSKEALLELGFSIKTPIDKTAISKPLNLAFVLDKSGSMSGENMNLLKSAMLTFIAKLRPNDHITIIFFDTEAVLAYGQDKLNKQYVIDILGALQANGGTNIYEGLEMGYKEVSKHSKDNSVNRVILLTDGYGSRPVDEILELSASYFKNGISVSTIGVGNDYNNSLLSLLSQYSGGLRHQAIESEGISKALEAEFESLLYPLASDLKVKVKYNNKLVYKTLYGVPEKKNSDNMVHFQLEKVYSSLNQMALMKFKIENPSKDISKNIITIEITYFDERKQENVKITKETHLEWTDETDAELIIDEELKNTYSIAVINQALKVIADLCDGGDYESAKNTINATLKSLKKITNEKYSEDLIPIIEEMKAYLISLDLAIKNAN